jgi:cytochrome b561
MPNNDPQKIGVLLLHMAVCLIVRLRTSRPPSATTDCPRLDRLAPITHYGFYVLVLLMVVTGYATAILAAFNRSLFQGSGDPLPPDFAVYPTFVTHATLAAVLAGVMILHVLAALFHQFVLKDGLLRRMFVRPARAKVFGSGKIADQNREMPFDD